MIVAAKIKSVEACEDWDEWTKWMNGRNNNSCQSGFVERFLTSDMYFSKSEMEQLLADKGIEGYDEIFVSCDHQATKGDGRLFRPLLELVGERTVLHIGDNEVADDEVPRRLGIDTYTIRKAKDLLVSSSCAHILENARMLPDRLMLGTILAHLFNSPFALAETNEGFSAEGMLVFVEHSAYDPALLDRMQEALAEGLAFMPMLFQMPEQCSENFCCNMADLLDEQYTDIADRVYEEFAFNDLGDSQMDDTYNVLRYLRQGTGAMEARSSSKK